VEEVYKNIEVLKGIPSDQLIPAMEFMNTALGVESIKVILMAARKSLVTPATAGPGYPFEFLPSAKAPPCCR
jgi:hypothetical protein